MLVARAIAGRRRSAAPEPVPSNESTLERELRLLRPLLDLHSVFLEIGAGDGALARRLAGDVERAYALDVREDAWPEGPIGRLAGPPNLVRIVHDGVRIPLPEGAVDVAFSRRVVHAQLAGICRALCDGGVYLTRAERPAADLRAALFEAGFSLVRCYIGGGRVPALRVPYSVATALEDGFRLAAVK